MIKKKDEYTTIEAAVDKAVDEMPDSFIIKNIFWETERRQNMCLTEYNEAETMQKFKEEGREEGRAEERKNTERERLRAEKEQKRAEKAEAEIKMLREELARIKAAES